MSRASSLTPNEQAVSLTITTIRTGALVKNMPLVHSVKCWHKFTVKDCEHSSQRSILTAILDQVHPFDLIPVSFWKDQTGAYFLARNCGAAIEKLCNDNLIVVNPRSSVPFKLTITLKYTTTKEFKIDLQKNIFNVLCKRYNASTKTLNLSRFDEDPELTEFSPLFQPKIMLFVLHLASSLQPTVENYKLMHNRIKTLAPLERLSTQINFIKMIDLSDNLLSSMESIKELKFLKITELYLDGNPLCENLTQEEYINGVTEYAKHLINLDGIVLKIGKFPTSRRNFLCEYDAVYMINQFLEHYYFVYDSNDRSMLKNLYHKNALFSLTTTYHAMQLSSAATRLHKYTNISRNIHKLANLSLMHKNLFEGKEQITNTFLDFPQTEHDPYSFSVDVPYYANKIAVVNISGVFRELPQHLLDTEKCYGFGRTFILKMVDHHCYIINDQMHIYNAFSWQVRDSFQTTKPTPEQMALPIAQSGQDRQLMAETFKTITTTNMKWTKKCLEDSKYDLKKALILFVDLLKQNKIPDDCFGSTVTSRNKRQKV